MPRWSRLRVVLGLRWWWAAAATAGPTRTSRPWGRRRRPRRLRRRKSLIPSTRHRPRARPALASARRRRLGRLRGSPSPPSFIHRGVCLAKFGDGATDVEWNGAGERVLIDDDVFVDAAGATPVALGGSVSWSRPTGKSLLALREDKLTKKPLDAGSGRDALHGRIGAWLRAVAIAAVCLQGRCRHEDRRRCAGRRRSCGAASAAGATSRHPRPGACLIGVDHGVGRPRSTWCHS